MAFDLPGAIKPNVVGDNQSPFWGKMNTLIIQQSKLHGLVDARGGLFPITFEAANKPVARNDSVARYLWGEWVASQRPTDGTRGRIQCSSQFGICRDFALGDRKEVGIDSLRQRRWSVMYNNA